MYDGWQAWRVGGSDGDLLDQLRARLIRRWTEIEGEPIDEVEDRARREPTTEIEESPDGGDDNLSNPTSLTAEKAEPQRVG